MDSASAAPDGGGPEALALSAARLYADGQHAQALEVLSQLAHERADDTKVAHNRALAAYRAGVLSQEQLLAQLTALVATHTQLAAAEQAGREAGGAAVGQPPPGDGDITGGEASQPPAAPDVSDTALPALNAAIVLWQTGRRSAALALAEPLWRCVEALPAGGQTRLCLLLLDGHLDACQPGKAQAVATYMAAHLAASSPEVALTVHVARARAHVLEGSHKAAKRELKEASTVVTQMHHQGAAMIGGSVTGWVAQVQAHCLKAQQELSRWNTGKAVRLLAAAQAVAASEGRVDPDAAQQQHQGGGEQQGSSSSSPLRAALAANGGTVLHAQGRHAAAAVAYEQALAWAAPPAAGPLAVVATEQVDATTYAAGLQHLLCGSFPVAFAHLINCSPRYAATKPALWLRLAECCLCAAAEQDAGAAPPHAVEAVLGEAPHAVLVLARASPATAAASSDGDIMPSAPDLTACDGGDATLSLGFAALCLRNVEHLLDAAPAGGAGVEAIAAADGAAVPGGSSQASQRDTQMLHCALLTWRSYLHLLTGYFRAALTDAMALLELAATSGGGGEATLLARCYAAEALCALGLPAEAVEHLSACLLEREEADAGGGEGGSKARRGSPVREGQNDGQEHNNTPGGGAGDGADDGPSGSSGGVVTPASQAKRVAHLSGEAARVALYVNLASLYCSQGEHGAAHGCCTTALGLQPRSVHALLALVYVELAKGEVDAARAVLARGRPMPASLGMTPPPLMF